MSYWQDWKKQTLVINLKMMKTLNHVMASAVFIKATTNGCFPEDDSF